MTITIGAASRKTYLRNKRKRIHPYMQDDFLGTDEIQEIRRKMYSQEGQKLTTLNSK